MTVEYKAAQELIKIARDLIAQPIKMTQFKPLKKNSLSKPVKVGTRFKTPFFAELKKTGDKETEYNVFAKVNNKYFLVSRVGWYGPDDKKRLSEQARENLKSLSVDKLTNFLSKNYDI